MIRNLLVSAVILAMSGAGCDSLNEHTKPQAPTVEQKPAVLLDRYELKDIRNGNYVGTALLDKQTGRVWTLGTSSKAGTVTSLSFEEAYVLPEPQKQSCPPNDPLGLLQSQSCTPVAASAKGESK